MPAQAEVYRVVEGKLQAVITERVRITTVRRLALLVTGLVAAKSSVVSQMAAGLWEVGGSLAQVTSIARRLRRTLHDRRVTAATCYEPAVRTLIDGDGLRRRGQPASLALDESSQDERVHRRRVSLTYWGTAVPLAWEIWPQNTPLSEGAYWRRIDAVRDRGATRLPAGLAVIVTADRAFDVPPCIDRVLARGWHWVIRLKAEDATRFLDWQGREHALKAVIHQHVAAPGQRGKARGQLFTGAGWRAASLVAVWAPGAKERLVVITDLPPRWAVIAHADRRFWIEPSFRTDKATGWQWEACQVTDLDHHATRLVAMAWATLLVLGLGLADARLSLARLAALRSTPPPTQRTPPRPQHARASLFTLGLRLARRWLARTAVPPFRSLLSHLTSPAWNTRWRRAQARRFLFSQTVRP